MSLDSDQIEWILLDPDLSTQVTMLPADTGHLYVVLNEPGSGTVKIPLDSVAAPLVVSGQYVTLSIRGAVRGGFFVENIIKDKADEEENAGRWLTLSGRGPLAILDDVVVWSDSVVDGKRDFPASTKGAVLKTLIDEAQARGALADLTYDFTDTDDSNSAAWTDTWDWSFAPGKSLLEILRQFAKDGLEFTINLMSGAFVLSAFSTEIGTDKHLTTYLRVGTNCTVVRNDERGGDLKNALLVKYNGGFVEVDDSTSITAYRRRERMVDASATSDSGIATDYGDSVIPGYKDPKLGIVVNISDDVPPRVFSNFSIGDYITLDTLGEQASWRVLGLQIDTEGASIPNVGVELNTLIETHELKIAREVGDLGSPSPTVPILPGTSTLYMAEFVLSGTAPTGGTPTAVDLAVAGLYFLYPGAGAFSTDGTNITLPVEGLYRLTWMDITLPADTVQQWIGVSGTFYGLSVNHIGPIDGGADFIHATAGATFKVRLANYGGSSVDANGALFVELIAVGPYLHW